MTHVICRLTAKNRDQLRNPTLGNRVWATFLQRRCVWAVGRLGVAACLACVAAAAVDRQARQSCLVWRGGGVN